MAERRLSRDSEDAAQTQADSWVPRASSGHIDAARRSAAVPGRPARRAPVEPDASRPPEGGDPTSLSDRLALLSPREREIVGMIAQGLTSRRIGERLVISRRTVDTHIDRIRGKLRLRSRLQIAALAAQLPDRAGHPAGETRGLDARVRG